MECVLLAKKKREGGKQEGKENTIDLKRQKKAKGKNDDTDGE